MSDLASRFVGEYSDHGTIRDPNNPVKSSFAEFFDKAVKDEAASRDAGRAIFSTKIYVRIFNKRKPRDLKEFPSSEYYETLFPEAFRHYQKIKDAATGEQGTPLTEWPPVTVNQVANLHYAGILTLEQLLQVDTKALKELGDEYVGLQAKAKAWVAQSESSGKQVEKLHALEAKLVAMEAENAELKTERDDLARQVSTLEKQKAK